MRCLASSSNAEMQDQEVQDPVHLAAGCSTVAHAYVPHRGTGCHKLALAASGTGQWREKLERDGKTVAWKGVFWT